MLVIVPDYIYNTIDEMLDREFEKYPDAEKDRRVLRSWLLGFVNEHGYIPDFTLQPKDEIYAKAYK